MHHFRTLRHPRWEDFNYEQDGKTKNRFHWLGDGSTFVEKHFVGEGAFYLTDKEIDFPPGTFHSH